MGRRRARRGSMDSSTRSNTLQVWKAVAPAESARQAVDTVAGDAMPVALRLVRRTASDRAKKPPHVAAVWPGARLSRQGRLWDAVRLRCAALDRCARQARDVGSGRSPPPCLTVRGGAAFRMLKRSDEAGPAVRPPVRGPIWKASSGLDVAEFGALAARVIAQGTPPARRFLTTRREPYTKRAFSGQANATHTFTGATNLRSWALARAVG